ncbi:MULTISPECIES: hypothetical protein [Clostridium]|uniref:hypothetical protein n=1 Tax=Clostridium TaxID=1485 RepID=UPI00069CD58D|nr:MULTISPECIES: hypothetical protein [Clostridium]KOF56925.1 hypothetical protein AGR56_09975 [Clostridium sp. DMHC 10]MCD2346575.1 hypothetical protein [Clostridium guangxiense]
MCKRKIIEDYYCDLNNLSGLLTNCVSSYRLLIGGASELNQITPATKHDVKKAIQRVNKLGDIIDELLKTMECYEIDYINYCKIKASVMECKLNKEFVLSQIEEELMAKGDNQKPPPL